MNLGLCYFHSSSSPGTRHMSLRSRETRFYVWIQVLPGGCWREGVAEPGGGVSQQLHGLSGPNQCHPEPAGPPLAAVTTTGRSRNHTAMLSAPDWFCVNTQSYAEPYTFCLSCSAVVPFLMSKWLTSLCFLAENGSSAYEPANWRAGRLWEDVQERCAVRHTTLSSVSHLLLLLIRFLFLSMCLHTQRGQTMLMPVPSNMPALGPWRQTSPGQQTTSYMLLMLSFHIKQKKSARLECNFSMSSHCCETLCVCIIVINDREQQGVNKTTRNSSSVDVSELYGVDLPGQGRGHNGD